MKEWIIWVDGGCYEGWRPVEYDTREKALEALKANDYYGSDKVLTRRLDYQIVVLVECEG